MKTPTFIESWTTKTRTIVGGACAAVLVGGILFAAYESQHGDKITSPAVETADGTVSNGTALLTAAEKDFTARVKTAGGVLAEAGSTHCFFVLGDSGFVEQKVTCGPVRLTGSNSGVFMDTPITFEVDANQKVVGSLTEPTDFKISRETGDPARDIRSDGVTPTSAASMNVTTSLPSSEMPVRIAGVNGTAPRYGAVEIDEAADIKWNPAIDNESLQVPGNIQATVVRAGQVMKVTDPNTGISYAPDAESGAWWVVEMKNSTASGWDGNVITGAWLGIDGDMSIAQLPATGSVIVAVPAGSVLSVNLFGTDYGINAAATCDDPSRISSTPGNRASLVVTPVK